MSDEALERHLHIAAQCWCDPATSDRVMDPALAEAFALALAREHATTRRETIEECAEMMRTQLADEGEGENGWWFKYTDPPWDLLLALLAAEDGEGNDG